MNVSNRSCAAVVRSLSGVVVCGVVDLASGRLLAIHRSSSAPRQPEDARIVATLYRLLNLEIAFPRECAGSAPRETLVEVHVALGEHSCFAVDLGGHRGLFLLRRSQEDLAEAWRQLRRALSLLEQRAS